MKYNLVLATVLVALLLAFAPVGAKGQVVAIKGHVNVVSTSPGAHFIVGFNGTVPFGNSSSVYNLIGSGGNSTFTVYANDSFFPIDFLATGIHANNFTIYTGNESSTFSISTGDFSIINFTEQNYGNATQSVIISGGAHCNLTESSLASINGTVLMSVSLGNDSIVSMGSAFTGNDTAINLVF